MDMSEGGSKEGRSTAAGKRYSSKILCPAVRLLGLSGQWRLLLPAAVWSGYQELYLSQQPNKPVTNHECTRTAGDCARPEMDGGVWGQSSSRALCKTSNPPLNFGSSVCCSHCVLWGCDFWPVLAGAEATPACSKVFHQFVNCYTERSDTLLNHRSSPTVFIFSLLSHLDLGTRSLTFIKDASYEKSSGEVLFPVCLLFWIKLLNQHGSYQGGMSFNNWWRLTLDWILISFHSVCSPQICLTQLLISFNSQL